MTLIVIAMGVMGSVFEGTHVITNLPVVMAVVAFVVALLIDVMMVFGHDAGAGDTLLRYRPTLPPDDREEPFRRRRRSSAIRT
jgi:hypothetical protein